MEKESVEQILVEIRYIKKELEEIKETQKALIYLHETIAVIKQRLDHIEQEIDEIYSDINNLEQSKDSFLWDTIKLFISFMLGLLSTFIFFSKKS
jgi:prefoldin subunit 5